MFGGHIRYCFSNRICKSFKYIFLSFPHTRYIYIEYQHLFYMRNESNISIKTEDISTYFFIFHFLKKDFLEKRKHFKLSSCYT